MSQKQNVSQKSGKTPSRSNSIQISSNQYFQPDLALINSYNANNQMMPPPPPQISPGNSFYLHNPSPTQQYLPKSNVSLQAPPQMPYYAPAPPPSQSPSMSKKTVATTTSANNSIDINKIDESLFEDLDYNPQLDVYWDALEAPAESYLNILPEDTISFGQKETMNDLFTVVNSSASMQPPDRPASFSRKHKREEPSDIFGGDNPPQNIDDDGEGEDGIKVMRFGSLGRIIASTVAASSVNDRKASISERTPEQQEEYRKELVTKIMKMLNQSNMNGLAKIIREKFHEACFLITPEVFEPISGRGDIMILFSLLLETYPDASWTTQSLVSSNLDTLTCTYHFRGTKLFSYPLNSLFKQIKGHISRLPQGQAPDDEQIVNEVAEYCHVNPSTPSTPTASSYPGNNHAQASTMQHNVAPVTNLSLRGHLGDMPPVLKNSSSSFRNSFSSVDEPAGLFTTHRSESDHNIDELSEAIQIPRSNQTLREVKSIETAVLKEGPTQYRRKMDFVFNEIDQIIRVVVINLIS